MPPRNPTEAGRQMDFNNSHDQNAFRSIRVSFDPGSNVNDKTDLHEQREAAPRNSTDAGRQIDLNDEQS
jgi:hypothetical protein